MGKTFDWLRKHRDQIIVGIIVGLSVAAILGGISGIVALILNPGLLPQWMHLWHFLALVVIAPVAFFTFRTWQQRRKVRTTPSDIHSLSTVLGSVRASSELTPTPVASTQQNAVTALSPEERDILALAHHYSNNIIVLWPYTRIPGGSRYHVQAGGVKLIHAGNAEVTDRYYNASRSLIKTGHLLVDHQTQLRLSPLATAMAECLPQPYREDFYWADPFSLPSRPSQVPQIPEPVDEAVDGPLLEVEAQVAMCWRKAIGVKKSQAPYVCCTLINTGDVPINIESVSVELGDPFGMLPVCYAQRDYHARATKAQRTIPARDNIKLYSEAMDSKSDRYKRLALAKEIKVITRDMQTLTFPLTR